MDQKQEEEVRRKLDALQRYTGQELFFSVVCVDASQVETLQHLLRTQQAVAAVWRRTEAQLQQTVAAMAATWRQFEMNISYRAMAQVEYASRRANLQAAVNFAGAQLGDVRIEQAVGGDSHTSNVTIINVHQVIHNHFHGPPPEERPE